MCDTSALNAAIRRSGYKKSFIAAQLSLSRAGLHSKIAGNTEFTASEIVALQKLLGLSMKERDTIFLLRG